MDVFKLITSLFIFVLRRCMWLKINSKLQDLFKGYYINYVKKLFRGDCNPYSMKGWLINKP